jgi:hypothetical protein
MKKKDARMQKIARLVQLLDKELKALESAHALQFDLKASLHDKLAASKRARTTLKEARHLRDLIAQALSDSDE